MALLNRLFSSRKKQQPQPGYGPAVSYDGNCHKFEFSKDQVRVLLFRECERRGRKLLFDSKAVLKIPLLNFPQCSKLRIGARSEDNVKAVSSFVEISNGHGYQYTRPSSDIKPLGEMIFGSVAMAVRGSTLKVHIGGSPPVLMFTKVTNSPSKRSSDRGLEDSYGSSINSMNEYFSSKSSCSDPKLASTSGSCPLDVPLPSSLGASQYLRNDLVSSSGHHHGSLEADSGCYTNSDWSVSALPTNGSFTAALASPDSRKGSGGSLSSLRRRWLRTASTSLDLESSQSFALPESLASCGSLPACGDDRPLRRTKLGVAVIINLTQHQKEIMQDFLLEHAALLESMVVRLHAAVERAYCRKELFVSLMVDASCDIEQSVQDLLLGPRLTVPIWLGLLACGVQPQSQHTAIASGFMQELCQLLELYDTKDTNFFISTLVTAVLTHHLGWVPTVTPGLRICSKQPHIDDSLSPPTLSDLTKVHPYNPLWAQAMDLFGALGHPLKTSRTIIMSLSSNKNRFEIIEKLLRMISYFIRCAGIERQEPKLNNHDLLSNENLQSTITKRDDVHTLSVNDRTCSTSTLRPLSGKCSPLLNGCQAAKAFNACEVSDSFKQKQESCVTFDNTKTRSENSLNVGIKEPSCELKHKQPCGKGLRRTMSYSSKMTASAFVEGHNNKEKLPFLPGCCDTKPSIITYEDSSDKISTLSCRPINENERNNKAQTPSQDSCSSPDKVIFVLGENEDLVGLKGRNKQMNDDPECCKDSIERRGKLLEQPLSFSGSEVESGFSECESFELSPARTASQNFLTQSRGADDSILDYSSGLKARLCSSKYDKNIGSYSSFSRQLLKKDEALHDCNLKIFTVKSFGQNESECDSLSMSASKLRSLARSLSVNLPVCLKSSQHEVRLSDSCVTCGVQVVDSESKENVYPVKEFLQTTFRKSMRRLRRAHSSFCVQSQMRKSSKSVILCPKCCVDKENVPVAEKNIPRCKKDLSDSTLSPEHNPKFHRYVELSLPEDSVSSECAETVCESGIAGSLFGGVSPRYIAERVLQGCMPLGPGWEVILKRDLALDAQRPTLDPGLTEAVAIVANVDSWEVQLISSHTYVVDRPGTLGVRAGLSQLVANMLESVFHLWKVHASPDLCLSFLESRLQEMLLRSQALSELLLTTEFCDMDSLTSSLSLEPNDVPLLLSVASTHSPEVTQRYGLSFR